MGKIKLGKPLKLYNQNDNKNNNSKTSNASTHKDATC